MLTIRTDQGDRFMEIIKQKARPYIRRGIDDVIKGRQLWTFDEAADTTKTHLLKHGLCEVLAEHLACVFARSYRAGVIAATQLCVPNSAVERANLHSIDFEQKKYLKETATAEK